MRRRRDSGVALVLALLVLVILIVVIGQMTISGLHHRTASENLVADLQNAYGTRSGYHQAVLYLKADLENAAGVDALHEKWAQPFSFDLGRGAVRVQIADAERFINLSRLVDEKGEPNLVVAAQLRRLVRVLRHPPETADRILDYVDMDNRGEFEVGARNERLQGLDELLRIEGLDPALVHGGDYQGAPVRGLRDFVTVWPQAEGGGAPGSVNLNTAPAEVLQALADEMGPALAEAIVEYRRQPGPTGRPQAFEKAEDLKRVPGISDPLFQAIAAQLQVRSSTFEIRARGTVGNVEKTWLYVVNRSAPAAPGGPEGGPAAPPPAMTLLSSRPLHDFLSTAPPPESEPR
jgi:competence ComEA-like helix-hairpin-helix protein